MCKSFNNTPETCNCDECLPPGSMDEIDPCDVVTCRSMVNGVWIETIYTYAKHRDCAHCGMRLEDREEGPECSPCIDRKTIAVDLGYGRRPIEGLTAYVIWNSSGRGRTYAKWFSCSWTVAQWKKQGFDGRVIARYAGGQCGPATWLYLRTNGELWRFWEREGRGLRATLLGTVAGKVFTPDEKLHPQTAEEYQESQRQSSARAIARACFG